MRSVSSRWHQWLFLVICSLIQVKAEVLQPTVEKTLVKDAVSKGADFYNWHRIMIKYCDGSSFTGDVQSVDKATNQHYRGARIFQTIMEELLAKGMKNAKNAILSGNSAGGLAAMIHCDRFRSLLPSTPRVKCLSDGGYFLLDNDGKRGKVLESTFAAVVNLHVLFLNLSL
ncbi:pectin acetylesterase 8-like [Lycium barbarum]|uniref:pectin acetylesterase 8-like n=1 Tax=Lycium barbarum TaxID=112863 RepID=UPI00293E2918|nr:pectin acetylesterase 8-like [Lycium barbarum]